jgi:hypothetical protein
VSSHSRLLVVILLRLQQFCTHTLVCLQHHHSHQFCLLIEWFVTPFVKILLLGPLVVSNLTFSAS